MLNSGENVVVQRVLFAFIRPPHASESVRALQNQPPNILNLRNRRSDGRRRGARAAKQHRLGTLDHTMQLVLRRCRAVGSCVGTPAAVLFVLWTRRERMSRGCMDATILGVSSSRDAHQVLELGDLHAGAIAAPTGTATGVDGRGVEPVGGPVVARGWRRWRVAKMAPGSFRVSDVVRPVGPSEVDPVYLLYNEP